ncbi:peptidoglycan-binding domain-containing protein [Lysobacter sp. LF1]|uniref:Peptidoglycan-binding domain-containing protein n=1 Tax=Lysobacter stagni TaxID=3045172 RepID=A0ABT6XI92_9GAMM|nr:peptidoglycan-binding domain-containing protein [Lysobacter sp. LF1]MDI9239879.1 peptidoglycan-binding domain-containing protein [Lysobacter sp. LF1]
MFGDYGADVRLVQILLRAHGYGDVLGAPIPVTGHFGLRTEEAIRAFKRDRGLPKNGIADASTMRALQQTGAAPEGDALLSDRGIPLQAR